MDLPDETIVQSKALLSDNFKSLIAGGVGGTFAVITGHPFDLLKVRCQSKQANSTISAIKQIIKLSNNNPISLIKNFYKGVIPPLIGVTPIFAISFWSYDLSQNIIKNYTNKEILNIKQLSLAGAMSAIPTTLIMSPIERFKVLLQTNNAQNISKILINPNSLFKGFWITLLRDAPGSAIYFTSYEFTKKFIYNKFYSNNTENLPVSAICIAGGMAGIAMWLTVFPIDTIKTNIQAQTSKQKLPLTKIINNIYINNNKNIIKGFFPGLAPALLRAFPANAATFLGVELTKTLFNKYSI